MYKKAISALALTLLVTGCSGEDAQSQNPEDSDLAEVSPSASVVFYISDQYLDDKGVSAEEFFNKGPAECTHEVFSNGAYTGVTFAAGFESIDGALGVFDFSGTSIPEVLTVTSKIEDDTLYVSGTFTELAEEGTALLYVDIEFPNAVSEYGGDAVSGYSVSENRTLSLELHSSGNFYLAGN